MSKNRMKQLGLTNIKQWNIYKLLYNNVSFDRKDVNTPACEQVYVKFAKFLAEQKKPNIWKDPKVELPESVNSGGYSKPVVFILKEKERYGTKTAVSFYNENSQCFSDLFYDIEDVARWCYEEDLTKQAGD